MNTLRDSDPTARDALKVNHACRIEPRGRGALHRDSHRLKQHVQNGALENGINSPAVAQQCHPPTAKAFTR